MTEQITRTAVPTVRHKRRVVWTDAKVADLLRTPGFHPDPEMAKFGVRVRPSGAGAFYIITRDPQRKQRWIKIGSTEMKIDDARENARTVIKRVEAGLSPVEAAPVQPDTVAGVIENFLKRHVEKNGLRSAGEVERILRTYVLPRWSNRPFATVKRSDVAALLDQIEDKHGSWVADVTLAQLRSVSAWFAGRNDDYVMPFVRGMRRTPKHLRARARILNDAELQAVWRAAESAGVYGGLVRMLLLSGQRRDKCVHIKWDDISPDGTWVIRTEAREKSNAGKLKLPEMALAIIKAQPRFISNPFVFAGSTGNFSTHKKRLDKASGVTGWTLHDLRRTARSLMSRVGVSSDHAERVLGHAIEGVEGVYDRHTYDVEKADALTMLAALVEVIVNPPEGNVFPIRGAKASH